MVDGEFCQIAQSMTLETAVGLARTEDTDLRFFLRPPFPPDEIKTTSTPSLLKKILCELPKTDVHECINFFTTTALTNTSEDEIIEDVDLDTEFQRDSHHWLSTPRRRFSQRHLVEFCLQALLSHSTVDSHCKEMVFKCHCLPVFAKLIEEYQDRPKIKSLVGKILANIR